MWSSGVICFAENNIALVAPICKVTCIAPNVTNLQQNVWGIYATMKQRL